MTRRQERFQQLLAELAAKYIEKNIEGSLVTVTNAFLPADLKRVTIFITVLPETNENLVLETLREKIKDFRLFLGREITTKFVPQIDIKLDPGKKTRELIAKLT